MEDISRILLLGLEGYEAENKMLRVNAFSWAELTQVADLSDYDLVVLDLRSASEVGVDWEEFWKLFNIQSAWRLLCPNESAALRRAAPLRDKIIVIGDPRLFIEKQMPYPPGAKGMTQFMSWTGLKLSWREGRGLEFEFLEDTPEWLRTYLINLDQWTYVLSGVEIVDSGFFGELEARLLNQSSTRYSGARLAEVRVAPLILPILSNKTSEPVAFSLRFVAKGRLEKRIGGIIRTVGANELLLASMGIAVLPAVRQTDDNLAALLANFGVMRAESVPAWVEKLKLASEGPIDSEISGINARIEVLTNVIAALEAKRCDTREYLKLLFAQGESFERIVRRTLKDLGANVEDPTLPNKEDGWLAVTIDGRTIEAVLEIKSTRNNQFDEKGYRQLLDWVRRGSQERGRNYKGIFIGINSIRTHQSLAGRPDAFSPSFKKNLESSGFVAIKGEDLLVLKELDSQHKLDHDALWRRVFDTSGIFDIRNYLADEPVQGADAHS